LPARADCSLEKLWQELQLRKSRFGFASQVKASKRPTHT
jgi:hypothetical protein